MIASIPTPARPDQFRYEFDFRPDGLEFARALEKHETKDEPWHATGLRGCPGNAVLLSLGLASRPLEIPETLWNAAQSGDIEAIRSIGAMYDVSGQDAGKNYLEAIRWYRMAANRGDDLSMTRIGLMYYVGLGVPKSNAKALRLLRMAAEKGNAFAMEAIGEMFMKGEATQRDYSEAYFWLSVSGSRPAFDASRPGSCYSRSICEKSVEELPKWRDVAAAKISPAKRAEVQERVRKWIETHPKIH